MLKMGTGRRASILAIFAIFLCESIDKFRKRVHNKFGKMNMAYRNTASRVISRGAQRNGVRIPDAERHCKVYVLSDWRRCAGHSGKTGEGFAEMARGDTPQNTKSGYSVPSLFGGFPAGAYASA